MQSIQIRSLDGDKPDRGGLKIAKEAIQALLSDEALSRLGIPRPSSDHPIKDLFAPVGGSFLYLWLHYLCW